VLLIYLWAGVLSFGAASLTLFNATVALWVAGLGVLVAGIVSGVPRMRAWRTKRET